MYATVPIAFILWLAIALILFHRKSGAAAATLTMFAGWVFLPIGTLPPEPERFRAMMGVALPSASFTTCASVIGLALLLGCLLFRRDALRTGRPGWVDLPVIFWCLVPFPSSLAAGSSVAEALRLTFYQALSWGAPWLMGRLFLSRPEPLSSLARLLVLLGLLCVPFALVEFLVGPVWYEWVFGYHPYYDLDASRYVGSRPILAFEDGNQYGMWMAGATVAAIWLWLTDPKLRTRPLPLLAAGALFLTTIAGQSAGSILLLFTGLAVLPLSGRRVGRFAIGLLVLVAVGYVVLRAAGLVSIRQLAEKTEFGRQAKALVEKAGRGSLGWRFSKEEKQLSTAWERPVLGHGQWDWWAQSGEERPWGLWLLAFGNYGLPALAALMAMLLLPVLLLLFRRGAAEVRAPPWNGAGALAVVLTLFVADSLLNSTLPTVLAAIAGGLAGVGRSERKPPSGSD